MGNKYNILSFFCENNLQKSIGVKSPDLIT